MSTMYILFWKNSEKFVVPNWKIVDSFNLKWNSWLILFLEMEFAWTLVRFKLLWIGLPQLFGMFNIFLGLLIYVGNSLHIIPW
jgi:hypothetical protein